MAEESSLTAAAAAVLADDRGMVDCNDLRIVQYFSQ